MNNNLVNKLPEDFRRQFGQVRVLLHNGKEAFYIHAFLFFLLELALDFIRLGLQGISIQSLQVRYNKFRKKKKE